MGGFASLWLVGWGLIQAQLLLLTHYQQRGI